MSTTATTVKFLKRDILEVPEIAGMNPRIEILERMTIFIDGRLEWVEIHINNHTLGVHFRSERNYTADRQRWAKLTSLILDEYSKPIETPRQRSKRIADEALAGVVLPQKPDKTPPPSK